MKIVLISLLSLTLLSTETFAKSKRTKKQPRFSNESDASFVITGGNTNVETYNANSISKYKNSRNQWALSGHYTLGNSNDVENARNWDVKARYDRDIKRDKFSVLVSQQVEGDRFSGYEERYNSDAGLSYNFYESDKGKFLGELGYRYTVEERVLGEVVHENKARAYLEADRQIHDTLYGKVWIEYVPNFTDNEDYLLSFEPSIAVTLTKVFSLKWAFKGIYDKKPAIASNTNFDYIYTTGLLARF